VWTLFNQNISKFTLQFSQGEVHEFSGEVQKFSGEVQKFSGDVQNDLRRGHRGAHLPTPPLKMQLCQKPAVLGGVKLEALTYDRDEITELSTVYTVTILPLLV
jgi:hypothetical protein